MLRLNLIFTVTELVSLGLKSLMEFVEGNCAWSYLGYEHQASFELEYDVNVIHARDIDLIIKRSRNDLFSTKKFKALLILV